MTDAPNESNITFKLEMNFGYLFFDFNLKILIIICYLFIGLLLSKHQYTLTKFLAMCPTYTLLTLYFVTSY